jgi:hypothetical protein
MQAGSQCGTVASWEREIVHPRSSPTTGTGMRLWGCAEESRGGVAGHPGTAGRLWHETSYRNCYVGRDVAPAPHLSRARHGRPRLPEHVRCVAVDAREKDSVKSVLLELLYAVLDEIEAGEPAAV